MKLAFTIVILACWSKVSIASDDNIVPEFPDYVGSDFINGVDESKLHCHDNILSINFTNAVLKEIGPNFISSHLITCLDLSNNHVEITAKGAFDKLPKLTDLYLSYNTFISSDYLFAFGGHETLETLIINNAVLGSTNSNITVYGSYPNLEILSAHKNGFNDIITSEQAPLPNLKILDLSANGMKSTNFVNLLPESLEHLYLQDNSFTILSSLKNGSKVVILTLDNNKLESLRHYSNNPTTKGLWLYTLHNLRYLSVTRNIIRFVDSDAFKAPNNLVYLNLSRNAISSLFPETFAKLESLKILDLSHNQLQEIINISAVINVTTLSLSYNKIQSVPEYAFKQMPELQKLLLNENQIKQIHINGFAYLFHLETLDLSNNKLSSLPEGWAGAFGSLQFLDLSENQFTSLESLSLSNTLPLIEVYLMMNPLKYLDAGSFDNLPKNVTVDLSQRLSESVTKY